MLEALAISGKHTVTTHTILDFYSIFVEFFKKIGRLP